MPYHHSSHEPRLRLDPSWFEILIERTLNYDGVSIIWNSRRLNLCRSFSLRDEWIANYGGFEEVSRYIEGLVGGTISHLIEMGLSQDMIARAVETLAGTFDEGIHQFMERVESRERERQRFRRDREEFGRWFHAESERQKEDPKAKARAIKLLESKLNPNQLSEFRSKKQFKVTGKDSKEYLITNARSFNVQGPDGRKYCGQLTDAPIEDQMLAQKILLETDPDKFFKHANVSSGAGEIWGAGGGGGALRRQMFGDFYPTADYFARPFAIPTGFNLD